MASVTFENVSKVYNGQYAVRELNLTIEDHQFLVLVGPSGCGKSTTLRMLAGLEDVSEGKIYIGDREVNRVAARDRDIAMVFQSYALYPHMSVYDNMAFGLSLRKLPRKDVDARVREAAALLGIEDLLKRKPGQLSGGQRQRVALGRAIVRDPSVFLLDEPLSNLDAKLRVQTRAEITKLHERLGTTFVYVTHDQIEAMTMADQIAVLKDGRLQQVGPPQELYDRPSNLFVAGFIGSPSMNILRAKVESIPEGLTLCLDSLRLPVSPAAAKALAGHAGREVLVGLRPENIHDRAFVPQGVSVAAFPAKIELAEMMGSEVYLHLQFGGETVVARVGPRTAARPGSEADLAIDTGRLYLFDPETEQALAFPEATIAT